MGATDPYADRGRQHSPTFRFVLYGMRLYLLCLLAATVYTVLWVLDVVDALDPQTIGGVWVVITSMGAAFLLLVAVFYRRELALY